MLFVVGASVETYLFRTLLHHVLQALLLALVLIMLSSRVALTLGIGTNLLQHSHPSHPF